jgi:hypothetical protein
MRRIRRNGVWRRREGRECEARTVRAGEKTGPSPVDWRKAGSNYPVLANGYGIPLSARVTRANRNDVTQLEALLAGAPPARGRDTLLGRS